MVKPVLALFALVAFLAVLWIWVPPLLHSPSGKKKILMCGRSTMSLWFKHWNWPYPLRIKTTYKPWPIPYRRYSRGNLYLEYHIVEGPRKNDPAVWFGEPMLRSFEAGLDEGQFDAAFFKFCFVDFPVKPGEEWQKRLEDMKETIRRAHQMTAQRKMKLIVGNALPLPNPNEGILRLQRLFNQWLLEFAREHPDVMIFDFFTPLTDESGRLKMELAHSREDHHPGDKAFALLDAPFFSQVSVWLAE
jgi:hypothetical protein